MMDEEMIEMLADTMAVDMRALGVTFYDDVGERIKPRSPEEKRVLTVIARGLVRAQCQTDVRGSTS